MGIFENPSGFFFSAGKLKIPTGMPTLADLFLNCKIFYYEIILELLRVFHCYVLKWF